MYWLQISTILYSPNYIISTVLNPEPIHTLQLEHNAVGSKEYPRCCTGSTAYMVTDPAGWESWDSPNTWELALGMLRAP